MLEKLSDWLSDRVLAGLMFDEQTCLLTTSGYAEASSVPQHAAVLIAS